MTEYEDFDATGLAELVAKGETTADELLDCALRAADIWQPQLNALTGRDDDRARRMIAMDLPDGPLRGVPFLLKDIGCETPDFPATGGSRATGAGYRFPRHSTVYSRLRAAGLVPFARTTVPECAIGPVTEAAAYGGPTRNPWNTDFTPGGSSGGAGAAVAARIVPAAQGSDGGGSIRMPASNCALVGMKPSRALIPDGPYAGEGWGGMAIDGVLTRTVRDQACLVDLLSGPDLGAPYYPPPLRGTLSAAVEKRPTGLRIALCESTFGGVPIHADCEDAVQRAARLLEAMGHDIVRATPEARHEAMMEAWTRIVACGTASWARALAASRGRSDILDDLEPVARGACRLAATVSGADYLDAIGTIHAYGRDMAAFFDGMGASDILLTATLAEPPARIGRFAHSRPGFEDFAAYRMGPDGVFSYSPFAAAFNASGQPAISVPMGLTSEGLPIGIQLAGPMGADELLISLAAALEEAAPWDRQRPPPPGTGQGGA